MNSRSKTKIPAANGFSAARSLALAMLLCAAPLPALSALTDIASVPLASSSTTVVKPNILFTLDNSGSMAWGHMPDSIDNWASLAGYKNFRCNSMYYNPGTVYVPPKNADGTDFTNASFTAARYNGFDSSSGTRNLSNNYIAYDDTTSSGNGTDSAQPAYYYRWNGASAPTSAQCQVASGGTSSPFTHTTSGTAPNNFTKVLITATSGAGSTDERQNFANWYTFYRTRLMMMKSATGRAFVSIGSGYRVGFITINPGSPVSSSRYLAIGDFTATQKSDWFSKLYTQGVSGSTPLREALSRAGRHFAGIQTGINDGMSGDPMQYSCQQNFSILTTDGYWNGNAGDNLTGGNIGNHDDDISTNPRPMFDGSVTTTSSSRTETKEEYSSSGCSGSKKKIIRTTTTKVTPILPTPGPEATSGTPSNNTVVNCTSSYRALINPNPQYTTPTTSTSTSGGASGTLADVAAYYYLTDLRAPGSTGALGTDVGTDNNVPSSGSGPEDDKAKTQHMTTFTMGLGLSGTLNYVSNYRTGAGDFAALRSGSKNWPAPVADSATALDDLWHAAVNGRGQFFSAADPDSVVDGLTTALAGVNARVASAAAAATSNLEPVAGDNFAYTASYKTLEWIGELEAKEINLTTGTVGTTPVWSARAKLDAKTGAACDNRSIKLFRAGATNNLVDFSWSTQACDASLLPTGTAGTGLNAAEQAYFGATQVAAFSQFPDMTNGVLPLLSVDQRTLAAGANLVNFLRGQRGREGFDANSQLLYRTRTAVLGDIVNAQPVFAKAPFADYQDTNYAAFKSANTTRTPMVYVAANDGMLHAFYAGSNTSDPLGGQERWAFIPTMVLPNLYKLADKNYGTLHTYSVDGTPAIADVFDPAASPTSPNYGWKTILVGGLNAGGRGYYAMDVTDPANPKGMWEFKHNTTCLSPVTNQTSDCHLGNSYGNPQIGKLADGRWVVFVTSGYNNVNSPAATGDGIGYLYVLNALTGQIIYKISTATGSATTPSGLGKINTFVLDTALNNTVQHLYGVDLLGNVWRFEVNSAQTATRLTTVVDASNNPQPISTKPELAEFGSPPIAHVFVATGKYIGASDLASTLTQSVWAIKDTGTYPVATPRSGLSKLTITNAGDGLTRTIACTTNCTTNGGWYVDLPDSGERVNVDMKLQLGTLVVASNVPQNNACNIGGYSWLNFFDARNGLQIAGSANFGTKLSDSLAVGINVVRLPDGRTVVIATTSDASQQTAEAPIPAGDPQGRRTSWRELVQ
jgi:type IV pilus assembly protein PilY1